MMGWQWHQLDHVQIICILLQTDNHASISNAIFCMSDALPDANQQCQNTEGNRMLICQHQLKASGM